MQQGCVSEVRVIKEEVMYPHVTESTKKKTLKLLVLGVFLWMRCC